MNDLYLIGNGFDLAHGLKTSYNDFLLWYLNNFLKKAFRKDHYEDDLLKIDRHGLHYNLPNDFTSVKDISQKLKELDYKLKAKYDFFGNIIENYRDYKWVDIEYEYYMALVNYYKIIEASPQSKETVLGSVKSLNDCFALIKKKLVEYLIGIPISSKLNNIEIERILGERKGSDFNEKGEKLFLCFNYTRTLELYTKYIPDPNKLIYIHGKLDDSSNPIIFGYGDEMDTHYEKIENLNNNEFLKNIKSFWYFQTPNYQDVIRFLQSGYFIVKIFGHSCGLSDRILLNTIFEHKNCHAIKIYHYEKSLTENDYFEKTQEISGILRLQKKAKCG